MEINSHTGSTLVVLDCLDRPSEKKKIFEANNTFRNSFTEEILCDINPSVLEWIFRIILGLYDSNLSYDLSLFTKVYENTFIDFLS